MQGLADILVPLITVVLSGVVALLVARLQVRAATEKLDAEFRRNATAKLFEARMAVYPELHGLLIRCVKTYWTSGLTKADLQTLISGFDAWEVAHAVFVSPLATSKFRRARILFGKLESELEESERLSNKKARKELLPEIYSLQMQLKTELGVLEADGYHNPATTRRLREVLRELSAEGRDTDA